MPCCKVREMKTLAIEWKHPDKEGDLRSLQGDSGGGISFRRAKRKERRACNATFQDR